MISIIIDIIGLLAIIVCIIICEDKLGWITAGLWCSSALLRNILGKTK